MEKYIVSRELAEKLKAAGYKPSTVNFYYYDDNLMYNEQGYWLYEEAIVAAPLSDELLESEGIPDGLIIHSDRVDGDIVYWGGMVFKGSWRDDDGWHQSLANALAELWLWNNKND